MFSIDDERNAAEQVDSVIRNLSVSTVLPNTEAAVQTLRSAIDASITAAGTTLSSQEHLNNARAEAATALSGLIDQLNKTSLTQAMIDRASRAVEDWRGKLAIP
jgi:hypothetical protein